MKVINTFNFGVTVLHIYDGSYAIIAKLRPGGMTVVDTSMLIPGVSVISAVNDKGISICRDTVFLPSQVMYIGGATYNDAVVSTMHTGYTGHSRNPAYKPGRNASQLTVINGSIVDATVAIGPYSICVPAGSQNVYTTVFDMHTPINVYYNGSKAPSYTTYLDCANTLAIRIGDITFG